MKPLVSNHIESDPAKCGGKPVITGTRIRVWDIYVASELRGLSPDEVAAQYPSISLADVYAALAYYWDNQETINSQMKLADEHIEQLKKLTGQGPLANKLAGMDSGSDSIPS